MPRRPKPWRRVGTGGDWWSQVRGVKVRLAGPDATEGEAWEALYRVLAEAGPGRKAKGDDGAEAPVYFVLSEYLERAKRDCRPMTVRFYRQAFRPLDRAFGPRKAAGLSAAEVAAWAEGRGWGVNTARAYLAAVKNAFRWAARAKLIPSDPLAGLKLPTGSPRESIPSAGGARAVVAALKGRPAGPIAEFLFETGCRPGEARALTAADCDLAGGTARLSDHKTARSSGRARIIFLSPRAAAIAAEAAALRPSGPIFRTLTGRGWSKDTLARAIRRARAPLGLGRETTPHGFRHRFATDASKTEPNGVVAALLGHASTQMVDRVYSRLAGETDTMRAAAAKVRPGASE